jgi:uncharacterized membrane protein YphA (DoxX/SURF4 family)
MLLLIRIVLAVVAWRKGWQAWALVPTSIPLGTGLALNQGTPSPDGISEILAGPLLIIEIGCFVTLLFMAVCGRGQGRRAVAANERIASLSSETRSAK